MMGRFVLVPAVLGDLAPRAAHSVCSQDIAQSGGKVSVVFRPCGFFF